MKKLLLKWVKNTAISLGTLLFCTVVNATPTNPVNGAEYATLSPSQPVLTKGKKVEVIEFFMYHCPACNMLEPALMAWVQKMGNNVEFKRIHVAHKPQNDPEARLFLTLEAMGLEGEMHSKVLKTWHVDKQQLTSDEDNLAWAVKNGIEREKFMSFYNSFAVINKLQNLNRVAANYRVDSTPTLIIDGKLITSMAQVSQSNPTIDVQKIDKPTMEVVDVLVKQILASKQ